MVHAARVACLASRSIKSTTSDSLPCIQRRENEQPKKSKERSTERHATAPRCDCTHLHDLPAAKLTHLRLAPCDELASGDFENTGFFLKEPSKEAIVSYSWMRGGSRDHFQMIVEKKHAVDRGDAVVLACYLCRTPLQSATQITLVAICQRRHTPYMLGREARFARGKS